MVPTTNLSGMFSKITELLLPLPLVLLVKLTDLIEYFSHFCNISPHCHQLWNLQVLMSRALLNNMNFESFENLPFVCALRNSMKNCGHLGSGVHSFC